MNANAKTLVTALRSGAFIQAQNVLKRNTSFCILGVVCELYRVAHPTKALWKRAWYTNIRSFKEVGVTCVENKELPLHVRQWIGFTDPLGTFMHKGEKKCLSFMNDHGFTFEELAHIIESEPEGLFVVQERDDIMKNKHHYCATCGEKIKIMLNPRRNPRQRRRGSHKPRYLPGHDLCTKCFRTLTASQFIHH